MPEWLGASLSNGQASAPSLLAWRIGAALVLGVAVSGIYRWARRGQLVQTTFLTTLVLLAVAIAMATQVIGDNVARAFSLVGALSVVRFRTVVKDTQDTAFVILAVVVGMAAGANNLAVALVGLGIVGVASCFLWPHRQGGDWRATDCVLTIRVALTPGAQAVAEQAVAAVVSRSSLVSAGTARQGVSLDLVYRIRLRPGLAPAQVVADLNSLEGVESVELRRAD
ncbi:DUF4956 domain-containing protein [Paludisphaera borealis]|uniref:DUF4956 domain-containing protein n=1 Tax=Paludisphaera borealis TaxID=1387353 RepID=A0A1U7CTP8_9BACT|nr:DUF4956 domain-containing protein [Paludisphaera borealis]APW62315.1 hypothetical protein BSF38_03854 [Paludisphaera borealis]